MDLDHEVLNSFHFDPSICFNQFVVGDDGELNHRNCLARTIENWKKKCVNSKGKSKYNCMRLGKQRLAMSDLTNSSLI